MRSFDVPNRHNYADRYNPIAHVSRKSYTIPYTLFYNRY